VGIVTAPNGWKRSWQLRARRSSNNSSEKSNVWSWFRLSLRRVARGESVVRYFCGRKDIVPARPHVQIDVD
jgi:hypothetical protein